MADEQDYSCSECSGDCSGANPPVTFCPMRDALQWIADNYENGHLNHVDFRVEAKHRADDALAERERT